MTDVIDQLAGIAPGSALDKARNNRLEARRQAQASFDALFEPKSPDGFSKLERAAVAAFVAGLHGRPETRDFYTARLEDAGASPELRVAVASEAVNGHTSGPYGKHPRGPLTLEDREGMTYGIGASERHTLGARLSAAFEHVHMLVLHPRDAAPPSLQALLDAGWSTTEIVTLSQLVAFLSFQIRVVAGLKALSATVQARAA
jgi:CMD domain protein